MVRAALCLLAVTGCGSTTTSPPPARLEVVPRSTEDPARAERARRAELGAAHRKLEAEQQAALAATCDQPVSERTPARCEPSCYPAERADPRAGTRHARAEITHVVCTRADVTGADMFVLADDLDGAKLAVRPVRGRRPSGHKPGSREAAAERAVSAALEPELARGDVIRLTGAWRAVIDPTTKDRLRCATVSHYTSMRRALDACGGQGAIACEASGNAAAHGINVVHYRLAEARRLEAAGNDAGCQQAALEAIAVARGLPRWRQYVTLNVDQWKPSPRYRTRFDGMLDEDTLFAVAGQLGLDAQAVYARCGGAADPKTTVAQEQSFHRCP